MRIELIWDDQAIDHIARHRVTPEEVVEMTNNANSRIERAGEPKCYLVYGRTDSGRYLKLVVRHLGQQRYRPITAYEMDRTDRRHFKHRAR